MGNRTDGKRGSFSGKLGYVLATAGSAVGMGNIWRFPYLTAKYGGALFIICYLLVAATFGFVMIISETALGRKTRKSVVGAYGAYDRKLFGKTGGWLNAVIPMIIVSYYCVIGGWVLKYLFEYICGNGQLLADSAFFNTFLGQSWSNELWLLVFGGITLLVIVAGVEKGIEKVSRIMMPSLIILAIIIAVYSMTRPGAIEGVKYLFVPNWEDFTFNTLVQAIQQMFYSLSIAMGILFTYGSYMKTDVNIEKSTVQVELFDTGVAILAALMIVPAVFAYSGVESLNAGPGLMFITLPKMFAAMKGGIFIGILFFVLVFFAALTSSISLAETCASTFIDELHCSRKKGTLITTVILFALGTLSAFGYGILGNVKLLGMQFLDFFDFISNSIMMPIAALMTIALIVFKAGINSITDEVSLSAKFKAEKFYNIVLKIIAPICLVVILVFNIGGTLGWF